MGFHPACGTGEGLISMNSTVSSPTSEGLRTLPDSVTGGNVESLPAAANATGRERFGSHWTPVLVAAIGVVLSSVAHYVTPPSLLVWHVIFQRLYYLPIVYAAMSYGLRGGLTAAAASGICYVPHIIAVWTEVPHYAINQYAEILVFFLVGALTGVLAGREKRRSAELRATTRQLKKVCEELEDSFEHLKRAGRLAAIGQLAAGVAHEIRNPLASIEGALNVMQDPKASESLRGELGGIARKECRRVNQLLTNLLEFARPRPLEYCAVDLRRKVESTIALVAHTARSNRIGIRTEFPPDLSPVECDPQQVGQVILNLLLNAVQAMTDGGEIVVAAQLNDERVVLSIRDEGCGILPGHLEQIFDPFFTTKQDGTGLGLSISHQIVSQHNGAIRVTRNTSRGMTFGVVLPLRQRRL